MRFLAPPSSGSGNTFTAAGSGNVDFVNAAGGGDNTTDVVNLGTAVNNTKDTIENFLSGDIFEIYGPNITQSNITISPGTNPNSSVLSFSGAGIAFSVTFNDVNFLALTSNIAKANITPTSYSITA